MSSRNRSFLVTVS